MGTAPLHDATLWKPTTTTTNSQTNETSPLLLVTTTDNTMTDNHSDDAPSSPTTTRMRLRPKNCSERLPDMMALIIKGGATLENRGSTARDHLANERTYLAWMRTGLALIACSLGLLKMDGNKYNSEAYWIALIAIVVLVMSTYRYFRNMQLLEGGMYEPNVHGILAVVSVVVAAIVTAFGMQYYQQQQQHQLDTMNG